MVLVTDTKKNMDRAFDQRFKENWHCNITYAYSDKQLKFPVHILTKEDPEKLTLTRQI